MKIKVRHDSVTKIVNGYFPDDVNYKNNVIDIVGKTIDGEPYIDITQEDWESNRSKQMIVANGIYKEYVKTDDELLQETKIKAIANREKYLIDNFKDIAINYDVDNIPQKIKDKRILTRTEINQIKQEPDIEKIMIEFE